MDAIFVQIHVIHHNFFYTTITSTARLLSCGNQDGGFPTAVASLVCNP